MALSEFEGTRDDEQLGFHVRKFVAAELWRLGCTPLIDDAVLVASGLATNAILHAGTGPEAAALTAMVRFTPRARSLADTDPASVLDKLNRALLTSNIDPM